MKPITLCLISVMIILSLTVINCSPAELKPGAIEVLTVTNIVEGDTTGSEEIEISSVEVRVTEIRVFSGGFTPEDESEQGEWINLYVTGSPLDLLQDLGQQHFLAFANVAATSYDEIVMVIEELDVTLNNDTKMHVTPNDPFSFEASFVVYSEQTTTIIFKIDVDKSVIFTGENQAIIKPLTGITINVKYEDLE
ncbi:MAG: DUF4382 domain-containing protein [Dehalococcoidia bacterium]|nr:MAG: DUF4382 domain-containing protein [Dehalococcoidia bacterium]